MEMENNNIEYNKEELVNDDWNFIQNEGIECEVSNPTIFDKITPPDIPVPNIIDNKTAFNNIVKKFEKNKVKKEQINTIYIIFKWMYLFSIIY